MNAKDWKIVQRVFDQALNTEQSEREKLIQEQLDGQPRLEQKVWELLEADAANSTFGSTGAAARAALTFDK
ncbi:MAG: hypothetical protein DHS20C11_26050 [Lysobacteraceae bacterium]|nr:MAG: hypothetical protein DHS20C11_26050 [Xanthomonadaceae bacterium]